MRKFAVVLLIALLLASCSDGKPSDISPEVTATPTVKPTIKPTVNATPANDQNKDYVLKLPDSLLPAGGYSSKHPDGLERWHDYSATTLTVGDYGTLTPFCGGYDSQYPYYESEHYRYGLMTTDFKVVIEPVFTDITEADGMLICYRPSTMIDRGQANTTMVCAADGSWVYEFENFGDHLDGRYNARINAKNGIFKDGEFTLAPTFDYLSYKDSDTMFAGKDGKSGIIDYNGNWILQTDFDDVYSGGDYLCYSQNGKYGVIDYDGNIVLAANYDYPLWFSDGVAATTDKDGGMFWYIDITGRKISREFFITVEWSGEGRPYVDFLPITDETPNYILYRLSGVKESVSSNHRMTDGRVSVFEVVDYASYSWKQWTVYADGTAVEVTGDESGTAYRYVPQGADAEKWESGIYSIVIDGKTYEFEGSGYEKIEPLHFNGVKFSAATTGYNAWYLLDENGSRLLRGSFDVYKDYIVGFKSEVSNAYSEVSMIYDKNLNIVYQIDGMIQTYYDIIQVSKLDDWGRNWGVLNDNFELVIPMLYDDIYKTSQHYIAVNNIWHNRSTGEIETHDYYDLDGNLIKSIAIMNIRAE